MINFISTGLISEAPLFAYFCLHHTEAQAAVWTGLPGSIASIKQTTDRGTGSSIGLAFLGALLQLSRQQTEAQAVVWDWPSWEYCFN